jgi:multiple sugar transport system permease protein
VWLMTAGGPIDATKVVSIDIYRIAFTNFDFGRAAALAVIVFFICLAFSIAYRRIVRDTEV